MKRGARQFGFYLIAAVLALAGDLAVFFLLIRLEVHFLAAQAAARIVGGVISFLFNKRVSFQRHAGRTSLEIRRFLQLYAVSYVLALVLLPFYHEALGLGLATAKPLTDASCFMLNFLAMKFYVYAES